jgi:hypothetical protein
MIKLTKLNCSLTSAGWTAISLPQVAIEISSFEISDCYSYATLKQSTYTTNIETQPVSTQK